MNEFNSDAKADKSDYQNGRLVLPLLKGYDDYEKEISKLFGLECKEVMNLIETHTNNLPNFKAMKTISNEDLERAL